MLLNLEKICKNSFSGCSHFKVQASLGGKFLRIKDSGFHVFFSSFLGIYIHPPH